MTLNIDDGFDLAYADNTYDAVTICGFSFFDIYYHILKAPQNLYNLHCVFACRIDLYRIQFAIQRQTGEASFDNIGRT